MDDAGQFDKVAVEEVSGAGQNDHGERLRSRPVQYVSQRHDIVFLAVNHEGTDGNPLDRKPPHSGSNEHEAVRLKLGRDASLHKGAEGKSGESKGELTEHCTHGLRYLEPIFSLAAPFIENTVTGAHAPEVHAHSNATLSEKSLRQRLHYLIVERPPVERMGMGNQSEAATSITRIVDNGLEVASRSSQQQALLSRQLQIRNRSTTRPFTRCSSMISSTSCRST
jgi:hypothetical protein